MAVQQFTSKKSGFLYYGSPTVSFDGDNLQYRHHNGMLIAQIMQSYGWSDNAIAGILGNMVSESTINPYAMEGWKEWTETGGFGLTQWTPATKYYDWAEAEGFIPYHDIEYQCERIKLEMGGVIGQYYPSEEFWIPRNEFVTSTKSPYELACAFAWNYERPWVVLYGTAAQKNSLMKTRGGQANTWYKYITGQEAPDVGDLPSFKDPRKGMSKLLLYAAGSDIV